MTLFFSSMLFVHSLSLSLFYFRLLGEILLWHLGWTVSHIPRKRQRKRELSPQSSAPFFQSDLISISEKFPLQEIQQTVWLSLAPLFDTHNAAYCRILTSMSFQSLILKFREEESVVLLLSVTDV